MESAEISRAGSAAMDWALARSETSAAVTDAFQMVSGVLMLARADDIAMGVIVASGYRSHGCGIVAPCRRAAQVVGGGSGAGGRASRRRLASASVMGMLPCIMPRAISSMG